MDPVAIQFGMNLRYCRTKVDLSQEALGFASGLHRTEIGLLERGERVPRIDTLVKVAAGVAVPPGELLDGIEWKAGTVIRGGFNVAHIEDGR